MGAGVTLTGDWEKMERKLDPKRFAVVMNRNIERALRRVGLAFRRIAVDMIRSREYEANAPSTIAAKGSSTPLINYGDLWRSIGYQIASSRTLIVGANKHSEDGHNIAGYLHYGTSRMPARPYIEQPLESEQFVKVFQQEVYKAMALALDPKAP